MSELAYEQILERIRRAAGGRPVELLAVSKGQPVEAIEALYRLGQRDFGENYVQELCEKAERLRHLSDLRWHFIGHLQTNKIKQLVAHVACVHSVDSERVAAELERRWLSAGRHGRLPVFIEVNIDGEDGKTGLTEAEALALTTRVAALPGLELRGLMAIPAREGGDGFRRLRELEQRCRPATRGALSMGMSADFEEAIAEGATHVRVGTALFGPRQPKARG